jgi:hypothetical protein
MIVNLPPHTAGMAAILDAIRRALSSVVSINQGVARIILLSPNGTSYGVTVDDTGALKTEVIDGKSRPR